MALVTSTKPKRRTPRTRLSCPPYQGTWTVTQEDGQELPGLVFGVNGSTYGGDKVQCSASPAIADGALFFTLKNKMSFTLKKNGEGRWVSPESIGTLKRK
jgi:hypothetical protein